MNENDIFLINVQIGGFRMPLRIPRKDEEIYRKAEKMVVKYLEDFQKKYSQRASDEILTLVAFQLAVVLTKQSMNEDITPLADKIKSLDQELNELLSAK